MKCSILTSLISGLMVIAPALAYALSDRFEDARQQTLNKLNQAPDEPAQRVSAKINDRFKEAHEHTLNKLSDRFEQERVKILAQ